MIDKFEYKRGQQCNWFVLSAIVDSFKFQRRTVKNLILKNFQIFQYYSSSNLTKVKVKVPVNVDRCQICRTEC